MKKLFKNTKFMFQRFYEESKIKTLLIFVLVILNTLTVVYGLLLSQSIVDLLSQKPDLNDLVAILGPKFLVMILLMITETYVKFQVDGLFMTSRMNLLNDNTQVNLETDYQNVLTNEFQELLNHAFTAGSNANELFGVYGTHFITLLHQVFQIGILSSMLFVLDSKFIILIVILLCVVILYRIYQVKVIEAMRSERASYLKKMDYLIEESGDFKVAKDMRIYGVKDWFNDIFNDLLRRVNLLLKKSGLTVFWGQVINGLFVSLLTGYGYYVFVDAYINYSMTLAELTFYISALSTVALGLFTFVNALFDLYQDYKQIDIIEKFYDYPNILNHDGIDFDFDSVESIEFVDVSFTYPASENKTLDKFNLKVNKDEKIAVVGLNGAGKSTLVKLLCNLIKPDSGQILINGIDNQLFNIESYYEQFSVVFQEQFSLPITIKETILQDKLYNEKKYHSVLEQSGVNDFLDQFEKGDDTSLVRALDAESASLSGGQHQKLKLAQALYKDSKIIILDEPTAALDSISENAIYQKYFDLSKNKTSIFITHRLASTKFCDRIVYIENGQIIENGTHDELMLIKGKYHDLFNKQAHYYKEDLSHES